MAISPPQAAAGLLTYEQYLAEGEMPDFVRNVHFEEQVAGDIMTFDYKLRKGIVQSSNALRLMRIVGLDVVEAS